MWSMTEYWVGNKILQFVFCKVFLPVDPLFGFKQFVLGRQELEACSEPPPACVACIFILVYNQFQSNSEVFFSNYVFFSPKSCVHFPICSTPQFNKPHTDFRCSVGLCVQQSCHCWCVPGGTLLECSHKWNQPLSWSLFSCCEEAL